MEHCTTIITRKTRIAVNIFDVLSSATALVCLLKKKKKRTRKYKTRPMNQNRDKDGFFYALIKDMKSLECDFEQYFKYSRMTPALFQCLAELIGPALQKDITKNPLSPEHRLMLTVE